MFAALFDCLITPGAHRKFVNSKPGRWLSVLVPLALLTVVSILLQPYFLQAMSESLLATYSPQQAAEVMGQVGMSQRIAQLAQPVLVLAIWFLCAVFLAVVGMVVNVRLKVVETTALFGRLSLITLLPNALSYIIIRLQIALHMEPSVQQHFGLDMFIDTTSPVMKVFTTYVNPFTVWYIVALGLGVAAVCNVSKSRGFMVAVPLVVLQLCAATAGAFLS